MGYVVDTNVHVLAADQNGKPIPSPSGRTPEWAAGATAEDLLGFMKQAGVDHALVVPSGDYDNGYTVQTARRYPDSFTAIGKIDVTEPDAGALLDSLAGQPGVGGLRFEAPEGRDSSEWLEAPATIELWKQAEKKGAWVALASVRSMDQLPAVRRLLERFPTVPIILRRMVEAPTQDGPPYASARDFFDLAKFPNVYSTFSHLNVRDAAKGKSTPRAFFEKFVGEFGANRLMWASFFPAYKASPEAPVKGLLDYVREELSFLPEGDLDLVLGGTARSLIPSLKAASTL
jgi:L-fuconolactonase